jgi:farnesyl diphosphate synthase
MFDDDIQKINAHLTQNISRFVENQHLRDICLYALMSGGKRLRALLVLEFCRVFGGQDSHALMTASAVEMVHCYSLIHDDLPAMDNDDIRRGKPTLHKKYDDATAILAGDGLLTLAFEILSAYETHPNAHIRCMMISKLASCSGLTGMVAGQYRDMDLLPDYNPNLLDDIVQMQYQKTGALIVASCVMGALCGEQMDKDILSMVTDYAVHIGKAFQIKDDLLDVLSHSSIIGKATQKDSTAGKNTIISIMGIVAAQEKLDYHIRTARGILSRIAPPDTVARLEHLTGFISDRQL